MAFRGHHRRSSILAALLTALLFATTAIPAAAGSRTNDAEERRTDLIVEALAERQREELGIPEAFFPFLDTDQKVETDRAVMGVAAPDLSGSPAPEVLETDLRYSFSLSDGQNPFSPVESRVDTKIVVRSGDDGKKLWSKRYDRDAWPISMRVGKDGEHGVVVISGLWNFYGVTEESTLTFDAFRGRNGKHLWTRNFSSITSYQGLTTVAKDAPLVVSPFDALEGRADDLLVGLATIVGTPFTESMATRVVVIDGATGAEHMHPTVDVGLEWWPIPLPTGDLDGDGLQDYATTNNVGFDPGGGQEPPSVGGTVYARKGTDGSPIWTTSGIEMELFAFTSKLPDVVASDTPDVGLSTYVRGDALLPLPISIPLLGERYIPRVYLFEGAFGAEAWHERSEWIVSPGDIDSNGQSDLVLGRFQMSLRRSRTVLAQRAVDGEGDRLWTARSVWRFETMPCPQGACFGGFWYYFDFTPDVQPDRVRDLLLGQGVEQNGAFRDSVTRVFDERTGRMRFEDEADLQSARVAIDGRGTDFVAFEYAHGKVTMSARDGSNQILWRGFLGGPDDPLSPRNSGFWAHGFVLPGDRCGDLVVNGYERSNSFYGIFDGASGRILWSRWTGGKAERPTLTSRRDLNRAC